MLVFVASSAPVNSLFPLAVCSSVMIQFSQNFVQLVLNGDIVAGRDVYRYQYLRNIVQRGHWQVFLAEIILKETLDRLGVKLNTAYLVKGTHDGYDFNETLMLKRAIPCVIAKYLSNGGVVNIAGKKSDKKYRI